MQPFAVEPPAWPALQLPAPGVAIELPPAAPAVETHVPAHVFDTGSVVPWLLELDADSQPAVGPQVGPHPPGPALDCGFVVPSLPAPEADFKPAAGPAIGLPPPGPALDDGFAMRWLPALEDDFEAAPRPEVDRHLPAPVLDEGFVMPWLPAPEAPFEPAVDPQLLAPWLGGAAFAAAQPPLPDHPTQLGPLPLVEVDSFEQCGPWVRMDLLGAGATGRIYRCVCRRCASCPILYGSTRSGRPQPLRQRATPCCELLFWRRSSLAGSS